MLRWIPSRCRPSACIAWTAGLALALAGCMRNEQRVFTVRGVVRAPYADGTITIQHEAIPSFMPAMTMPFNVVAAEVGDLVPGDRVEFEFRVGVEQSRATKFRKIGTSRPLPAEESLSPTGRNLPKRLRAGDAVPPFSLIDQESRPVTNSDFEGRQTVVSFIFTRCPVPEFCPLIAKKLHAVQTQLREQRKAVRAQILTISIDPEFDQPDVLRAYGQAVGADFNRWRLASGTPPEVENLARLFALRIERGGGSLDHTLATAIIGPDGRVVEIWRGNAWKPEEVVARIVGSTAGGK